MWMQGGCMPFSVLCVFGVLFNSVPSCGWGQPSESWWATPTHRHSPRRLLNCWSWSTYLRTALGAVDSKSARWGRLEVTEIRFADKSECRRFQGRLLTDLHLWYSCCSGFLKVHLEAVCMIKFSGSPCNMQGLVLQLMSFCFMRQDAIRLANVGGSSKGLIWLRGWFTAIC